MTPAAPRQAESGYVMLFVLVMSAIVAIGLYEQLPRAAFEAQRDREALLIDHGEQYKRGIQLYVRKLGRYPAKMEDLDNTQNIRFLRKHFFDPMTGKEEWRLLHMGANGKLIDSKIKAADPNADQWHQGSITEFKGPSTSDDGQALNANIATRKRPSDDQIQLPMEAAGPSNLADPSIGAAFLAGQQPGNTTPGNSAPGSSTPGAPGAPGTADPNAPPQKPPAWLNGGALPGMPPGQRGLTIPPPPPVQLSNPNAPTSPGDQSSVSGNGGYGSQPVTPPPTPAQTQSQTGQQGSPYSTTAGPNQFNNSGGFGQQGTQTNASNMINNLLTTPRPGGAPSGLPGALNGIGGSVVGGLAGVASTYKGLAIKRYNDQDDYSKWEFFYDMGAEQAAAVQSQMNLMNQGQTPGQQPGVNQQSTFGQQPGFNQPSTFGQQQPAFNQQPAFGQQQQPGLTQQQQVPPPPPPPPQQ